jgi:hypothetical protein
MPGAGCTHGPGAKKCVGADHGLGASAPALPAALPRAWAFCRRRSRGAAGPKSAKREIRPIPPSDADRDCGLKLLDQKATVRLTFSIELFSGVRVRASSNPRSTWERSTRCELTAQRSRQGNDVVDWEMRGECRTRLRRDACASSQCGSSAVLTDPQIWSSPSKPTLRQPYWRDRHGSKSHVLRDAISDA